MAEAELIITPPVAHWSPWKHLHNQDTVEMKEAELDGKIQNDVWRRN